MTDPKQTQPEERHGMSKTKDKLTAAQLTALRELDTKHYRLMRYPAMGMRLEERGYVEGELIQHSMNYATGESHWKRAYRLTDKGVEATKN